MDIALKERLYLAKESKHVIYVEKCPDNQYQVDGIRFLYRIFKKKKPGVILNDSPGFGKRIQLVLFISALQPILDKPVLILCPESKETKWLELFEQWTNMAQEVIIETTDPFKRITVGTDFKKPFVYVNPFENISLFSRREWSLLIVENDVMSREVIQSKLSASFKIWSTSVDIKKNLKTHFLPFYKWLYPKETIDLSQFLFKSKSPKKIINRGIKLDAFLEDIVLRRSNISTYNNNENEDRNKIMATTQKVSRKNKDATGTKIKRTKRKPVETSLTETIPTKVSKNNDTINEAFEFITENIELNNQRDENKLIYQSNIEDKTDNLEEENRYDDKDHFVNTHNVNESLNVNGDSNDSLNILESNDNNGGFVKLLSIEDNTPNENKTEQTKGTLNHVEINNKIDSKTSVSENVSVTNEVQSENLFSTDEMNFNGVDKVVDVNGTNHELVNKKTECDANLSEMELKLKRMEEATMKKFKGSFLDSMF